jgi:hypothetical protein
MRKRLLGSMRRIGSLRSLQMSPTKTIQTGDSPECPHTEPEVSRHSLSSLHTPNHQFSAPIHSIQINHSLTHARLRAKSSRSARF